MRLSGKVVLITGASRGIGAACALACARAGADVALASKSLDGHPTLPGTLREVAAAVEALGRRALPLQVDVRAEEQVDGVVARTVEALGRLDALVNNAGALFTGPVADTAVKRFDLVGAVNARGAFLASRAAIPHLRERGGHVLMMSPPFHTAAAPGKAPYLASKLGMTLLAQAIDAEEERVAAHALWPVALVRSAATLHWGMAPEADLRTPEVVADATVALLARDPLASRFRAWYDEDVLREEGITDLSRYRCVAGHEPAPLSARLVDPSYQRPQAGAPGSAP